VRKTAFVLAAIIILTVAAPVAAAPSQSTPNRSDFVIVDGGARASTAGVRWSDPLSVESFLLKVEKAQGSDSMVWLDSSTTPAYVRTAVIAAITRSPDSLVITETVTPATPLAGKQMLESIFGSDAATAAATGWTCGWGNKKVQYKPGLIVYYWFNLRTDFCWNGTSVQATPVQSVNGDGSWGWAYEGCITCTVVGWPKPTAYKSYALGHMNLFNGIDWNRYPWIQHIVYGNGTVSTTGHD
jgi:hypothetical protein